MNIERMYFFNGPVTYHHYSVAGMPLNSLGASNRLESSRADHLHVIVFL